MGTVVTCMTPVVMVSVDVAVIQINRSSIIGKRAKLIDQSPNETWNNVLHD